VRRHWIWTATAIALLNGGGTMQKAPGAEAARARIERGDLLVIAHRGRSGVYPENTMAAFKAAIPAGADFFELDAHLSREGIPVVLHDAELKRTAGLDARVQELALDEIRKLDAGAWKDARFKGEHIPTLEEALAFAKDKINVMVELKSGNPGLPDKAVEIIRRLGMGKQVVVASFDEQYIRRVKELDPGLRTLGLQSNAAEWEREDDAMADILGCSTGQPITAELLRAVHRRGMQVWVWTVDDPVKMGELAALGVDGIITNYPERITGRE